ncbi:MAG: SLC13 family permease [Flavobacteriales bacterium]
MQRLALQILGPILAAITFLAITNRGIEVPVIEGKTFTIEGIAAVAAMAVWMAFWWTTEAVPIVYTALLPLVLFPLLGILPMKVVAPQYTKEIVFLFIGGFLLAFAMERWNLHRRTALRIMLATGTSPFRLVLGMMIAAYFLSMWISNTATAAVLLPTALALLSEVEEEKSGLAAKIQLPMLLGIAYCASIGGMATLTGTAPNLVMANFSAEKLHEPLSFANWFVFGAPVSFLLFMMVVGFFWFFFRKGFDRSNVSKAYIREAYNLLGKLSKEEKIIVGVFIITVIAWFTLRDINFGVFTLPGWANFLPGGNYIEESTVAMFAALLLMLVPASGGRGKILPRADLQRVPLDIIFLFGGGFSLALAFEESGLMQLIGSSFGLFSGINPLFMLVSLALVMTFLTEFTSNTASTILILPLAYELAIQSGLSPVMVMFTITISASCAFMLPVATPPNTIVFGSGRISVRQMASVGFWINLASAALIGVYAWLFSA